ncbi:MAG TPA: hypothetical protein VEF53_01600 [Patescibacteria group bacterium]|nr:hypothetical protein [Patescibacteria group bacterium]
MINLNRLVNFVSPFYENKDIMHNLSHIERMITCAKMLIQEHGLKVDENIIIYGSYFHGFIYRDEELIKDFLREEDLSEEYVGRIVLAAWESQKDEDAKTSEGMVLHDAHLIEGGKTFLIVKSLVTGTARGQKLEETIDYIECNILGKGKCYYPLAQELYREKEEYAREFMRELRVGLCGASTSV